jgi:hypothetical protein
MARSSILARGFRPLPGTLKHRIAEVARTSARRCGFLRHGRNRSALLVIRIARKSTWAYPLAFRRGGPKLPPSPVLGDGTAVLRFSTVRPVRMLISANAVSWAASGTSPTWLHGQVGRPAPGQVQRMGAHETNRARTALESTKLDSDRP